jgi:hypothetical protein
MNVPIAKHFWIAVAILGVFASGMIFLSPSYEEESTLSRREIPYLAEESRKFVSEEGAAATPKIIPDGSPQGSGGVAVTQDQRDQFLGERAKPTAQFLCEEIAPSMLAFTKESSSNGTVPYMVSISNIRATADYRKSFPFPNPGEKIVYLQCRGLVIYSINQSAETDYFLMIDSEGNSRLRYEPDNSTAKYVNK